MQSEVSTAGADRDRVRTVEELERELREARQQKTATSEILRVISISPTDAQPVFDAVVASAVRLLRGNASSLTRIEGNQMALAAMTSTDAAGNAAQRARFPLPLDSEEDHAQVTRTRAPLNIADAHADPRLPEAQQASARIRGYRSLVVVPLLRHDEVVGTLGVSRRESGGFTDDEIAVLQTFADQAVISIENTRLFEEVQARTKELQESLEYQTATSEVLGVISRSPSQPQPVLDAIVEIAARLCQAENAMIFKLDGGKFCLAAAHSANPEHLDLLLQEPPRLDRGSVAGRAALECAPIHIHDVTLDNDYAMLGAQRLGNYRTMLGIPLLRKGVPIGSIVLHRSVVRPYTDKEIKLVGTFADQAVIAIENTRLFEEVQARNRDLTALGEVGRAVSSTLDLKMVLKTIVERAVDLSGTDAGSIFYYRKESGTFELGEASGFDEQVIARLRKLDISATGTGLGEAISKRQPLPIPDLAARPSDPLRDAVLEAGLRASLVVPLLGAEGPLGALVLRRRRPGEFSQAIIDLMQSFADQSAIALENARLFEEIAQKSRELEIASQHKSQFVANMSHELRTPLAAILGYAELMQEGFYGTPSEKSLDALTRIRSNGKHLLGLINTVLDIAKIESGQFSLNLCEYAVESVVETVRAATESLAETKKLALKTDVAKKLPVGLGDEQRLTQVLLNLVGNAIKFTDVGDVRITATAMNGHFTVAVTDTGPGIPAEELNRVFEQFHQIDNSHTKAKGGTGLGLAIAKQIVEMHGGRIWVESTLGQGAIFQMQLPIRAEFRKATTT